MRIPLSLLILVALVIPLIMPATATITDNEFPEARVFVTNVVDGDTIDIAPAVKVDGEYRYRVMLADINAPELGTPDGDQAKNALAQLLANYGGVVYLDIDNVNGVDQYGRIVAVVYVRYNSTHLLNVNKWLVDNGYAEIVNFDNEFDPNDWSLYEPYPSSSDNYPIVNDYTVTVYNPGFSTTHGGVSYAVTPDGSYVAFAVAEQYDGTNNPTPKVRVMIFNTETGGLEANITIDQAYNSATNAFQGFIAIAANNTGFLVVWNEFQDTIGTTSRSRIVEWAYIGKTGDKWQVATKGYSYGGSSYQYAPMAAYIPSPGNWSVFYVYRASGGDNRLYVNTHTGGLEVPGYTAGYASLGSSSTSLAVGVDYYGRLLVDKYTGRIAVVARTWNGADYDMGVVVFDPTTTPWGVSVVTIDNRQGDQGPSPISYLSGSTTYYYLALFGNVHSAALDTGSSTRILAVYNNTSTSLAYFVYDVTTGQTVKEPTTLAARLRDGYSYYPWVIAGKNGWLVIYSDGYGNYNYTYIDKDGNIVLSSPVALGGNIGWVRGVFDPDNNRNRFIIVFSSKGPKNDRDIFLVYVDESTKELSKYVVPVAAISSDEYFTLPVYLNGRLYLAYIGGSTHIAVVEPGFYQPPTPIPEPWITGVVALVVVGTVVAFYRSRRKHSS